MATKFDNIFRPLAKKLVNDTFGTSATLRTFSESYNVTTGKNTRTATDTTVKISPPAPVAESRIAGVVEAGDARTVVAASPLGAVRPSTEDALIWDSKTWQIVQVNPIVSGDLVAAYELIFRA